MHTKHGILVIGVALSVLWAFVGTASATSYYVNPGQLIQAVVNAASPRDIIIVRDGIYNENINVNTPSLTIQSELEGGNIF